MSVETNLNEILDWHRSQGSGFAKVLEPGIPENKFLKSAPKLKFPPSILELYKWHNGSMDTTGTDIMAFDIIPGYYFMSLRDAVADYARLLESTALEVGFWKATWFPFFKNDAGDFYVVECAPQSRSYGAVIRYLREGTDPEVLYANLEAMLKTINECLKDGVYCLEEDGYFGPIKENRQKKIARKHNPRVSHWQ